MKKKDNIRVFFVVYMTAVYVLDLISTYLAMNGGGSEQNPVLRYFLASGGLSGYLLIFTFFMFLVAMFMLTAEILCYFLKKNYKEDVVYISVYSAILAVFSIIQISNIIGNLFIWLL